MYIDLLENEYKLLKAEMEAVGLDLPQNEGNTGDKLWRKLDCAVVEHLHSRLEWEYGREEDALPPFDSARALFGEGKEIYPGAGFKQKTHIQICVRNPNCIKGYFDPRKKKPKWPVP